MIVFSSASVTLNGLLTGVAGAVLNNNDGVLVIMNNGYTSATGTQHIPSSPHQPDTKMTGMSIRKALEGYLPEYDKVVVSHKGFYRINATVHHTVDVRDFDHYYDAATHGVRFDAMIDALKKLPAGIVAVNRAQEHGFTLTSVSV